MAIEPLLLPFGGSKNAGRSSQSFRVFRFNLSKNGYRFRFGYFLSPWREYGTPLFLQTTKKWGEMNKSLEESALREAGFHHHANTYLLPIQIQPGEDDALAAVLDQLQKAIGRLVPSTKILDKPKG